MKQLDSWIQRWACNPVLTNQSRDWLRDGHLSQTDIIRVNPSLLLDNWDSSFAGLAKKIGFGPGAYHLAITGREPVLE